MRIKCDTNYLVLEGAQRGSESCQGTSGACPVSAGAASLAGEGGDEGVGSGHRSGQGIIRQSPRMSELDGSQTFPLLTVPKCQAP